MNTLIAHSKDLGKENIQNPKPFNCTGEESADEEGTVFKAKSSQIEKS
jgi:hypothetical protein